MLWAYVRSDVALCYAALCVRSDVALCCVGQMLCAIAALEDVAPAPVSGVFTENNEHIPTSNKLANLPICQFARCVQLCRSINRSSAACIQFFYAHFPSKGDGAAAMAVTTATVADGLRSHATHIATLDALEALATPIASAVALAAAPALVDAMATETVRAAFDRCGLMLTRLLDEAVPDPAAVYGAATGGERLAALFTPALLVEALQRASSSGQPLTREDAMSYACLCASREAPAVVRGYTAPEVAAGRTVREYWSIVSLSRSPPCPTFFCHVLTPVYLCRRAGDERGADDFTEEDALRRRAAPDADATRRAAPVGGAARAGDRRRVARC